ncbi:conserved hypothetical protein [Talaromyces stipitatus ATCC 10500]|uniref:Uncharacterized protein n=1 Tax=Talaromyces stipitatus (strain ATCC 10500 / CBS 375.48 / QM 6759 / NRRL 1006) TaxID=441959 RepID=B8MKD2_TALSN|nr:uncharacterized protein TSTA_047360 [Talaromyces stipitatus ATCC 10500]EED15287.1 conserved hypothetical protein [Talaromyces stipitatus ATCC 10500]
MIFKNLLLFTCLAYLGQSSPITESSSPETNITTSTDTEFLSTRSSDGVWLDVYHSGSCDSGWEQQPTSGWVWSGQCKTLEQNTYGARLGHNKKKWKECILKFWEGDNCHGHATTWPTFMSECIATANKQDGQFYLGNGAKSVMLIC